MENMNEMFSKMIGTLAIILLIAAFIGNREMVTKWSDKTKNRWKYILLAGAIGGIFGIYGNVSGFELNGAVISVRDMGPMLAGCIAGPIGGLIAGLMAGLHRLLLGGITAYACVVATCCIGLICGLISMLKRELLFKPLWALLISVAMEAFHLGMVLLMVKPFDTAFDIVKQIALPFIAINALGFVLMTSIINQSEKQHNLNLERNRLKSELEVANVIQHSLLPKITADYPGRSEVDISAFMEAAKEVGGDFYDVFFVGKDKLAFVIGDVSGKGVPAALFMANSKITLQNCIRDMPKLSEAIATANNALCAGNEADMFITLWVGVLDLTSGEMNFISAGHNPPVIVKNAHAAYLTEKSGLVLAGMEGVPYKEHTLTLQKGDMLYLYTDGVTEADNAAKELYGEERLLTCFDNAAQMSAAQVIQEVKQSVDTFVNGNTQFDDMTMLCFKYR